jgi:hypothetical protein
MRVPSVRCSIDELAARLRRYSLGAAVVWCLILAHPSSAAPPGQVFATSYGASGSDQSLVGAIAADSHELRLADAIDFADGQGIVVWGAGSGFTAGPLTNVIAKQQGAAGKTTYSYKVAPIDRAGGVGVPVAVSVTDGNATLSTANFVMLSVTYGSGDAGFVVWKSIDRGPYSYDGASSEKD